PDQAVYRAAGTVPQRGPRGFLEPRNCGLDHLFAAQVHERDAGIPLHVGGHAADLAGAGDDVPLLVAPQVEPRLLQFGVVDALDPLAASARPILIDEELIVILDEKLGGVARMFLAISEGTAGYDEVAGEDRGSALPDQALAQDDWSHPHAMQVDGRIAAGRAAAHDRHVRLQH